MERMKRMKRIYSVYLNQGYYSNGNLPAGLGGSYTDLRLAIKVASDVADRYFPSNAAEWQGGLIESDTGVVVDVVYEMSTPVWTVSRRIGVAWEHESSEYVNETIKLGCVEYHRSIAVPKKVVTRETRAFEVRIRPDGYLIDEHTPADSLRWSEEVEERLSEADSKIWDEMKKELQEERQ